MSLGGRSGHGEMIPPLQRYPYTYCTLCNVPDEETARFARDKVIEKVSAEGLGCKVLSSWSCYLPFLPQPSDWFNRAKDNYA